MKIPLLHRLKKQLQAEVARLQDEVVEALYGADAKLVLHGGTAIWRCYGGNRFSEDLDFYASRATPLEAGLRELMERRGLSLLKLKKTENLFFAKISDGRVEVRVEINFARRVHPVVARYERADGSFLDVLTLSPEDFLLEKSEAYAQRGFVRDLYDAYHLSSFAKPDAHFRGKVRDLLTQRKEPVDAKNLKAIVYAGAVPSAQQMREALARWWT